MKLFEYTYVIHGIEHDAKRNVARVHLRSCSTTNRNQIGEKDYTESISPLECILELPANFVYTGNKNYKAIRKEFKRIMGEPVQVETKLLSPASVTPQDVSDQVRSQEPS